MKYILEIKFEKRKSKKKNIYMWTKRITKPFATFSKYERNVHTKNRRLRVFFIIACHAYFRLGLIRVKFCPTVLGPRPQVFEIGEKLQWKYEKKTFLCFLTMIQCISFFEILINQNKTKKGICRKQAKSNKYYILNELPTHNITY